MEPKMGVVEYVSSSGHQVDGARNCFLRDGTFLTEISAGAMVKIKNGRFAGMGWTFVNVIVANE